MFTIPTKFGIAHACVRMLQLRGTGCSICDLSRMIATPQLDAFTVPSSHYVSNNLIYVWSHLFAGTDSIAIDLMTMEDWLFSQHMPPTILLFLLHYNLFSHLDVMEPLSLEYLGPVAVFQQNIYLREAAQTSSSNIAHSAWMHESDARHTLKCDIYEFNKVRNRCYRYTMFQ